MKLKTAIRGRLVISCCHFRQADHGLSPDPDGILYGPGPIVNKLLKYLIFLWGASILTSVTILVDQEIH